MSAHRPADHCSKAAPAAAVAGRRAPACPPEDRAQRTALTAYTAFRERHYEPYLRYAALRIGRGAAAEAAVVAAFTELAVSWTAILGGAGPAAAAWQILHDHIDRALGCGPTAVPAAQVVQTLQHDALVLHEQMQLSPERIAEVLGLRPGDLPSLPARAPQE
ncbi:hypothetical protein ABZ646_08100 [Streptomyces sp. NPDC007162]|uniref:hypothetical protein n=1 Tax=Streptomyces sp. NPDC007162 TaxID=3156917 RepID=UPI0033CA2C70